MITAAPYPLIVTGVAATTPGEMISLSYLVPPETLFLLLRENVTPAPPPGHTLFLFKPSFELMERLRRSYTLSPTAEAEDLFRMKARG